MKQSKLPSISACKRRCDPNIINNKTISLSNIKSETKRLVSDGNYKDITNLEKYMFKDINQCRIQINNTQGCSESKINTGIFKGISDLILNAKKSGSE